MLAEWFANNSETVRYVCYGEEVSPTTGNKHHQCYVQFFKKQYFNIVKTSLGVRVHLEGSRGTPEENKEYCAKDGKFLEFGEISFAGKRNDILDCVDDIKSGMTRDSVVLKHFMVSVKYPGGVRAYQEAFERVNASDDRDVFTTLLCGPTGCGKTYFAVETGRADPGDYFMITGADLAKGNWWDGYQGQRCLIIDEYYDDCMRIESLLQLLDRFKVRLPVKGSFTQANWRSVYITTNQYSLYPSGNRATQAALGRRISRTFNCFEPLGLGQMRDRLRAFVGDAKMPVLTAEQKTALENCVTDDEMDD